MSGCASVAATAVFRRCLSRATLPSSAPASSSSELRLPPPLLPTTTSLRPTPRMPSNSRWLSSSAFACGSSDRYIVGKSRISPTELRGSLIDESDDVSVNIDALAAKENQRQQIYPDEETLDRLYSGIKYRDLPYVTIKCTYNHTRFWVNRADGAKLFYTSPKLNGFINAAKRTNVAAQATGQILGQRLRQINVRCVRVRVEGFNAGRIAAIAGITQAGVDVAAISDITKVDWGWCQRAKKRKRRN